MPGDPQTLKFRNHYECLCGSVWWDDWSCIVDDDCPQCGLNCSPSESEDIEPDGEDALDR